MHGSTRPYLVFKRPTLIWARGGGARPPWYTGQRSNHWSRLELGVQNQPEKELKPKKSAYGGLFEINDHTFCYKVFRGVAHRQQRVKFGPSNFGKAPLCSDKGGSSAPSLFGKRVEACHCAISNNPRAGSEKFLNINTKKVTGILNFWLTFNYR